MTTTIRAVTTLALLMTVACDREERRTFDVRHMDPTEAATMIETYVPGGRENMLVTDQPPSITVFAPAVRLEQVEQLLATYDRALPDVLLRFQIIEANGFTETDPAIADVQQALQDLFRFSGYRLIGEAVVRAKAPGHVEQRVAAGDQAAYTLSADLERVISGESGRAVALRVDLRSDYGRLLSTSLTVPSGQTVVVGSAPAQANGSTLILVVRPVIDEGA